MKNVNFLSTLTGIALVAVGILLTSCESEQKAWNRVEVEGSPEARLDYLEKYSGENHAHEVRELQENYEFEQAVEKESIQDFELFLSKHPESKHANNFRSRIEILRFEKIISKNNIVAIEKFLKDYPEGTWADKARKVLASLREESNLIELADKGLIHVEARGAGIDYVAIKLTSLTDKELTAVVPVGTFFVCDQPKAQNMVATAGVKATLSNKEVVQFKVPVACANRPLTIPNSNNKFEMHHQPAQEELELLTREFGRAENAGKKLLAHSKQAAVWIVTDDADYKDMGVLVSTTTVEGVTSSGRAIGIAHAAIGMKLCDDAEVLHGKRMDKNNFVLFSCLFETHGFFDTLPGIKKWALGRLRDSGVQGATPGDMILWRLERSEEHEELQVLINLLKEHKPAGSAAALHRLLAKDFREIQETKDYNSSLGNLVQTQVPQAICHLRTEESIPYVIDLLNNSNSRTQEQATRTLQTMKDKVAGSRWEDDAIQALLATLETGPPSLVRNSIEALKEMKVPTAVDPLINLMLNSNDRRVREIAAQALGEIAGKKAIVALKLALSQAGTDELNRRPFERALSSLEERLNNTPIDQKD